MSTKNDGQSKRRDADERRMGRTFAVAVASLVLGLVLLGVVLALIVTHYFF